MVGTNADTFDERPSWVRGVLASYGHVTPTVTRDNDDGSVSVTRLSFPIQIVIVVIMGFVSAFGCFSALSSGIRTDQAVILQKLTDYQKLADERNQHLTEKIDRLQMEQRMQQEYINKLFDRVSSLTGVR